MIVLCWLVLLVAKCYDRRHSLTVNTRSIIFNTIHKVH